MYVPLRLIGVDLPRTEEYTTKPGNMLTVGLGILLVLAVLL